MRYVLTLLGCGALTVLLSACESTEQESAKIGLQSNHSALDSGTVHIGAVNHEVKVSNVTLLGEAGRRAVALRLTGTSSHPQIEVPVLVDVVSHSGRSLYTNDTAGLESALQRMPLLRPGKGEWWVDDQVLTSESPAAVHVRIGSGGRTAHPLPEVSASVVEVGEQGGSSVITGRLVNRSGVPARKVLVFAVGVQAGKVSAAGRAQVPLVAGGSATKPAFAQFQIFLVGSAPRSTIQLTVAPTAS
jgi:hypothetical protein